MKRCPNCASTTAQAAADAKILGLLPEFKAGIYSCCDVVSWADEQWLAWAEAACEDDKPRPPHANFCEVETGHYLMSVKLRPPGSPK